MAPTLSPGYQLGGCQILGLLGRGGMAEVYLAEQPALRRHVAVKILPPDRSGPELIDRFLREARTCSRIEHPNVVTIHNVGAENGYNFIVMQYIEGKNLAELLEESPSGLRWPSAVRLAHLAGKGLHAVHERDLLHRDVKPSNIMLSNDGRLVLMDFGLVCPESGSDLTETGIIVGTPAYMSPEQCRGENIDRRSDIFALGSTLYTLLTGKRPFTGNSTEVFVKLVSGWKPPTVHQLKGGIPEEVSSIVAKAMAPKPEDRFPTARHMNKALAAVIRAANGDESTSRALVAVNLGGNETMRLPALEPVDTVGADPAMVAPLDSTSTWASGPDRNRWILGVSIVGGLSIFALLMNLIVGGGETETRNPTPTEPSSAVTAGMVPIPAGTVYLGNEAADIRAQLAGRFTDADSLKLLIDNVEEPGLAASPVAAFWIDRYEVTNAEYYLFMQATGQPAPSIWNGPMPPAGREQIPVTSITYEDAEAYARWRGKELPTLEQWVRAFRGDTRQLFPWGNEYAADLANVNENKLFAYMSPVSATPRDVSPFGVYNLVGNASEFIRGYQRRDGSNMRMSKGASYSATGYMLGVGSATFYYAFPLATKESLGFRCVVAAR